jgi:hypothetical protein
MAIILIQTISNEEKQKCKINHMMTMKLMQPLLQNQNNIHILNSVLKRLDLHQEFSTKDRKFCWNYVPFKVHTLLGMLRVYIEANKENFLASKGEVMQEAYLLVKELSLK